MVRVPVDVKGFIFGKLMFFFGTTTEKRTCTLLESRIFAGAGNI